MKTKIYAGTLIGFAALALATAMPASAAGPEGPVTIAIPAGPGGANDRLVRGIRDALVEEGIVSQDVIVENRPGGGGAVAWTTINRNEADPSQISSFMSNLLTNELTGASPLTYEDLTPIATFVFDNACFAVNPDHPTINSAETLFDAIRNRPEDLTVGIAPGAGNHWHIGFVALADALGADVSDIAYAVFESGGAARTALLGQHINLNVVSLGVMAPFHESGDVTCVAVASAEPLEGTGSGIPTLRDLGIDLVYTPWRGIVGPGGMSREDIAFWEDAIRRMLETETWKSFAESEGYAIDFLGHEETLELLANQRDLYRRSLTALGLID